MRARWYRAEDDAMWEALCASSHSATFLHTRGFLAYHGERFVDRSVVFEDDSARLLGVMPAATHLSEPTTISSHPGISYGGVLHSGKLRGGEMIEALVAAASLWHRAGFQQLDYKVVPHIYHRAPAQDDLYALYRLGAQRVRCDLSACIDLQDRLPAAVRRRRGLRKAVNAGVSLASGGAHARALWAVLDDNLQRKHGARPTHTLGEIAQLAHRFPEAIEFKVAMLGGAVVAGVVLFHAGKVSHAQYIASTLQGQDVSALDLVFESAISAAVARGARWFDFGISNEDNGTVLNGGLYQFKAEFGAGGVVHEFYRLNLSGFGNHAH